MTASTIFELAELEGAAELVHRVLPPTPQYAWPKLEQRAGCTVWVKHENHTPTGAFKVRGGLVYLDRLSSRPSPTVPRRHFGDARQSWTIHCIRCGTHSRPRDDLCSARQFRRTRIPRSRPSARRVVEFGRDFDEAKHEASRVAAAEGLHFVPSFHRDLVIGVASYALELLRSVAALDAVYVGVGMGSGIAGLITVRDLLGLKTEIIGVGAAKAPATALSFAAGRPIAAPSAQTFADGLATREPHAEAIARYAAARRAWWRSSEDAIAEAMRIYFDDTHQIAEGAGAAPLAALLQERRAHGAQNVAVVLERRKHRARAVPAGAQRRYAFSRLGS